ncbi:protein phosphatase 1 regulatory subunit 21-like isoform X2 [Ostrea edulis]|uniref:protein phosphatase 1 regulatory subunit 21-like isoform X2 n=1 Tax=Ostrea edulis TaxID=37623 RepID=UPI0024AFBAF2|nr:protein phosphatase 1 regulatory subunit 21-like isoform X2 [Ostrea edulis]
MADAQKYQKLATEYAKLKAQIPVLKKAYLDEQATCHELKEKLKECEQSVRKYEQEVDSLTFRNQQLSTRVLILQEELDNAEAIKKKHKHKHDASPVNLPSPTSVYSEELMSKIHENEMLHKQVAESNLKYQSRLEELEILVKDYEGKFSHHQEVLDSTIQKDKAQVDRLQEEKAMLEVKCQTMEKEIKSCRSRTEIAENQLKTVQCHLQRQLEQSNKIIADKLPFIDTKNRDLNGLNLPTHDRRHQLQARELVSQATNHMTELVQALSNFYTYSEQRSKIYPADGTHEPYSPVNIQYCKYLHENMSYLRPVEQALKHFLSTLNEDSLTTLETATELLPFSTSFKKMVAYINKLLPYQLSSIEEECAVSSCTSSLESKNMELHASLKHLTAVFNKLDSYIELLAAQSSKSCCHPQKNHAHFFFHLCQALKDLNSAVREVSKHYNSKVSLEHQLPTATQKLKTTDECVVSSLISLVTCTGKFSAFLSGNLEFFGQSAGYRTRGSSVGTDSVSEGPRSNPAIVCYRQRAAGYLSSLGATLPDSVPHKVAVQNRQTLLSSAESKEGLSKQLVTFQQRVGKLEQEKEHWMLELQLLQIKYDNEIQKVKKLEKEVSLKQNTSVDSIEDNISVTPKDRTASSNSGKLLISNSLLGQLDQVTGGASDSETREILIKNHFTKRINEMMLQHQQSDSKCVAFHSEVRALHKQLQIANKVKTLAEEELKTTSQNLAQLKDELQTTTKSYEGQLSMMSEHLAGMNEKLTQQKDEIDDLRSQLSVAKHSNKKSRK